MVDVTTMRLVHYPCRNLPILGDECVVPAEIERIDRRTANAWAKGTSIDDYLRRERLLKTLQLFDRKITENIAKLTPEDRDDPGFLSHVDECLEQKTDLVNKVLMSDQLIVDKLTEEQERVAIEVNTNRRSQQTLSKFKSDWIAKSGEELDQKL